MALLHVLQQLRKQYYANPYPQATERKAQLKALRQQLLAKQDQLYTAAAVDFGQRSDSETRMLEVLPTVNNISDAISKLGGWMKPSKRHVSILFQPASNQVMYQPLGVVGVIVPWNYPIFLALGPLVGAIAAGNKVMVKLSESTPTINQVLKTIIEQALPDSAVVIEGEADVAAEFSALPFDHLLYTGSTAVGYHVMKAASANLTPVTLELGGKSPVLLAPDADITAMASRIMFGKACNGGQTCVAPDYLLLPESALNATIDALTTEFQRFYPQGAQDENWTSVINARHWQRLTDLLAEAKAAGAQVISLAETADLTDPKRRMPIQLVINAPAHCKIWQEEIFGPLLPLRTYQQIDEAFEFIRSQPRPLAFYLFTNDKDLEQKALQIVHAGGVCINDTLVHVGQDDLPFGGIGPSGMGHYHGHEGFLTFSHAKAVHKKGRFSSGIFAYPHMRPKLLDKMLNWLLKA
jgi:coniferyl-aldehyde dehydrogenase